MGDMRKRRHTLESLIDSTAIAAIPMMLRNGLVTINIRNVEDSGIWIENKQTKTGVIEGPDGKLEPVKGDPRPTVTFIPWTQIAYIVMPDTVDDSEAPQHLN